jgi:hypothetical protein
MAVLDEQPIKSVVAQPHSQKLLPFRYPRLCTRRRAPNFRAFCKQHDLLSHTMRCVEMCCNVRSDANVKQQIFMFQFGAFLLQGQTEPTTDQDKLSIARIVSTSQVWK